MFDSSDTTTNARSYDTQIAAMVSLHDLILNRPSDRPYNVPAAFWKLTLYELSASPWKRLRIPATVTMSSTPDHAPASSGQEDQKTGHFMEKSSPADIGQSMDLN